MRLKSVRKVTFDPFSHTYLCGDKVLIGVTTLMKKHRLGANYDGIKPEVLQKAAEKGSAIHQMLEDYDNHKPVITTDYEDELNAYKRLNLDVNCSEYLVTDGKMVASSIDKVLNTEEENVVDLGDVKTTYTLHREALAWQLGIYKYLFEKQNKGIRVRNCYGIHVRGGKAVVEKITPVDETRVKALFEAEQNGVLYEDIPEAKSELSVFTDGETDIILQNETKLAELESAVKQIKSFLESYRSRVYEMMVDSNVDETVIGDAVYKLKRPSVRNGIDTERLKKECPDIYEKYLKTTMVKGSVTFIKK